MADPIRITVEDVNRPEVEARLAEQRSFGFTAEPVKTGPQPLIFRPWFALMLAGLVAGLIAWAIIEPGFDDGIRLKGTITGLNWMSSSEVAGGGFYSFQTAGVQVYLPRAATVLGVNGQADAHASLANGMCAELLGETSEELAGSSPTLIATMLRLRPAGSFADTPVDIAAIASHNLRFAWALFPLTAAMVGLAIAAIDGVLSRAWGRAARSGAIGALVGLLGGLLATIPAGLIYVLGQKLVASTDTGTGLMPSGGAMAIQIMGRGLAWCIVGALAGMGPGVAMRSKKLVTNGLIGGSIGALIGGILFDPINLLTIRMIPTGGAELSRAIGLALVGAGAGCMIGLVELAAREAWVRVMTGPLAGKEFILYRDPTWIGSSPKSEIFLFKDAQIAPRHLSIRRAGEHYEVEDQGSPAGTFVGDQRVKRLRLRDRDRIAVGQTQLEFRLRDE